MFKFMFMYTLALGERANRLQFFLICSGEFLAAVLDGVAGFRYGMAGYVRGIGGGVAGGLACGREDEEG